MFRLTGAAFAAVVVMAVSTAGAAPPLQPSTGYYAVVDIHGNLVRGSAGTAAFNDTIGAVTATFPVDVTNCSYVVTLGRAIRHGGGNERPGFISAMRSPDLTNGVYVSIRSPNNIPRNRPFHLFVAC